MESHLTIMDMFEELSKVTDSTVWGKYAYSRELVQRKISASEQLETIELAKECGLAYAEKILDQYAGWHLEDIVLDLGLVVEEKQQNIVGDRILFAQFTTPNLIEVMQEPIQSYKQVVEELDGSESMPSDLEIYRLLLAHELFHWIEEEEKERIYTRTKKIKLWGIWNYSYQTSIHALGEIAAMYFSQRINQVSYSPFVLDMLLSHSYNPKLAHQMYNQISQIKEAKRSQSDTF